MASEYQFEITWKVGVKFDEEKNELDEVETVSPIDEATVRVDVKLICDQDFMAQAVTLCLDLSGLRLGGEPVVERDRIALQNSAGGTDDEHLAENFIDNFDTYAHIFAIASQVEEVKYELGDFNNGETKIKYFVLLTGKSVGANAPEGEYTIPAYVTYVPTGPIAVEATSLPFTVKD